MPETTKSNHAVRAGLKDPTFEPVSSHCLPSRDRVLRSTARRFAQNRVNRRCIHIAYRSVGSPRILPPSYFSAAILLLFATLTSPAFGEGDGQLTQKPNQTPSENNQIGTVLGKPVFARDLNENVELREDLVRLFVLPVETNYLKKQKLDPEAILKKRIPDPANRAGALMFVRQRVLHRHLYEKLGGRVVLTAFGPIAFDAHRKWLSEREKAGEFRLNNSAHRKLLFAPLKDSMRWRLTEDPKTIKSAFDPAATEKFIQAMAKMPAQEVKPTNDVSKNDGPTRETP